MVCTYNCCIQLFVELQKNCKRKGLRLLCLLLFSFEQILYFFILVVVFVDETKGKELETVIDQAGTTAILDSAWTKETVWSPDTTWSTIGTVPIDCCGCW